jgi:hydrogenase maturation protease
MNRKKILVLGLGNKILCDDGIGVRLTEHLQESFSHPEVRFETACSGGLDIIEMMYGYEQVIVIDAIKTTGYPGQVYLLAPVDLASSLHISTFHDISFPIALELAQRSGMQVPGKIAIIAVNIIEDLLFSEDLSDPIEKKYNSILQNVKELLIGLLPVNYAEKQIFR